MSTNKYHHHLAANTWQSSKNVKIMIIAMDYQDLTYINLINQMKL